MEQQSTAVIESTTLMLSGNIKNDNNIETDDSNEANKDLTNESIQKSDCSNRCVAKASNDGQQKLSNDRRTRSMMKTNKIDVDNRNGHLSSATNDYSKMNDDKEYDEHLDESIVMDDDDDDYEPEESKDYEDVDYVIGGDVDRTIMRSSKSSSQNGSVTSASSLSSSKHKKRKHSSSASTNQHSVRKRNRKGSTNKSASNQEDKSMKKSCKSNNSNESITQNSTSTAITNNFRHLFQENEHQFDQILPPEILIRLFQMVIELNLPESPIWTLIRLSQVCEHWRQIIVTNSKLWSIIDLSSLSESRFPMERFRRLHQNNNLFQSVQHIDLSNWKADMAKKMLDFLADCSQNDLHSLSIRRCRNVTASFLQSVIRHAKKLRLLNISGITASQQHNCQNPFQTPSFRPLIESCGKSLRSLFMSENMMTSFPTCFSMVLESCPNLEVLDISNVHSLGSRCSTVAIDKFQQSCPNIRILRAANIAFQPIAAGCIVDGWSRLEELSIPFNVDYMISAGHNDVIIEQLTKSSENLKLLDIRGSPSITPRGLVKIPAWSLQHLSISNCPKMQDESLGMVFQKWNKSLIDVDLSWNKSESCIDECVRAICDVPTDQVKLRSIDLRGSAISLESLRRLILHCNDRLKTIDLQSCRSLPRGMKRLFQGQEFQRLRQLMLDGHCDD